MIDKKFLPVWDIVPGDNELNLLSNSNLIIAIDNGVDIESIFLKRII